MKEDAKSIKAVAITARDVATVTEIFMVDVVLGVGLCWCLVLAVHAWRAVEEHKK